MFWGTLHDFIVACRDDSCVMVASHDQDYLEYIIQNNVCGTYAVWTCIFNQKKGFAIYQWLYIMQW